MCWDRYIEQDTVAATPQLKPATHDSPAESKPAESVHEIVEVTLR